MGCGMGIIIRPEDHPKMRFVGEDFRWCEMKCNREDDHDRVGEHWYDAGFFRTSWMIEKDVLWLADSQEGK